jgi:hypothetical protein
MNGLSSNGKDIFPNMSTLFPIRGWVLRFVSHFSRVMLSRGLREKCNTPLWISSQCRS